MPKPFKNSSADRFVRYVLIPIVVSIGLYGLMQYVVTGYTPLGIPERSIEAADPIR